MRDIIKKTTVCLVIILIVVVLLLSGRTTTETGSTNSFEIGYTILLEADFSDVSDADEATEMTQLVEVISTRLFGYIGNNSTVQQDENRILVKLPRDVDIEVVKSLLTKVGFLEFREVERKSDGQLVCLSDYLEDTVTDFFKTSETIDRLFVNQTFGAENYGELIAILTKDETGLKFIDVDGNIINEGELNDYAGLHSWIPSRGDDGTPLTGALLDYVSPSKNSQTDRPVIEIEWNDEGAVIFDQIAARLYNPMGMAGFYSLEYVLGIFLDNNLISAPQMTSQKYEGKGVISGNFTIAETDELANMLKSSALPVPVTIVEIIER